MDHQEVQSLLSTLLNMDSTLYMLGVVDDKRVIEKFEVKIPEGNFYIHPIYVSMYTNICNLESDGEIYTKWNVDGLMWEDVFINDLLRKYLNLEGQYLVYLKVYSLSKYVIHPESWSENSLYNSF